MLTKDKAAGLRTRAACTADYETQYITDPAEAERLLTLLAEGEEVTFQTFDDHGEDRRLSRVLHGDLGEHAEALANLNRRDAGIFWMVNQGDGRGRKAEHVTRVRALFVDLDGAPLPGTWALEPHIVVESSPGRFHVYWAVVNCPLDRFSAFQKALAVRFHGDPIVCDLPRVMRLPGFYHRKRRPFLTRIIHESGAQPYPMQHIVGRLALVIEAGRPSGAQRSAREYARWLAEGVDEGRRDQVGTVMAGRYLRRGLSASEVAVILADWNARNRPPMADEHLEKIILSVAGLEARRRSSHGA